MLFKFCERNKTYFIHLRSQCNHNEGELSLQSKVGLQRREENHIKQSAAVRSSKYPGVAPHHSWSNQSMLKYNNFQIMSKDCHRVC